MGASSFVRAALFFTASCAPAALPVAPAGRADAAPIVFIEDDYPRALAEARALKVPVFVDTWASWCHTCLSLRAFVFPDPAIRARAKEFVWLAIDTEKPENAAFLRTHPPEGMPTLWVIDPVTERPALRWLGSATATELAALLDDAKVAVANGNTEGAAAEAYFQGMQDTAGGRFAEATADYRRALTLAPPAWPRRAHVVEALSARLRLARDWNGCLELARIELEAMPRGTSAKGVAMDALECVGELPDEQRRVRTPAVVAAAERIAANRVDSAGASMLDDDRSELYEAIVEQLDGIGQTASAKRVAADWSALLESAAGRARTSEERAVFDAHRCEAFIELDEPERAIPVLQASERDFPEDYNPPARLASAYLAMGRYDDARAAIDRAITRARGPRLVRLFTVKADILAKTGDHTAERAAIAEGLERTRALVLYGSSARARQALETRAEHLR